MEIERKIGFFTTAYYRVLDYEIRQTNDLYLICCGQEHFAQLKIIGPSVRTGYHLHIISQGSGYLSVGGVTRHLTKGQLFLLQPNTEYTYWPDMEDPWAYTWIQFDGKNASAYMEKAGFPSGTYVRDSILSPDTYIRLAEDAAPEHVVEIPVSGEPLEKRIVYGRCAEPLLKELVVDVARYLPWCDLEILCHFQPRPTVGETSL